MITIHLTADDLAETRFAFSPVWEVFQSFRVFRDPSKNVFHLPWLNQHRARVQRLDLTLLEAVMPVAAGYMPDFLTPPPEGPYPEFDDELARIRSTPHEQIRLEMLRAYDCADADLPPVARSFLAEPDRALDELVDALRGYWSVAVEPHWPRLRAMLEGDVMYRARVLALEGAEALFADLHPTMRWDDGVLTIDKRWDKEVTPGGRGLVLIPLAFACPGLVALLDPPWQPTIAYPPRGIATLWEAERPEAGHALVELVGETRAAILRALEIPMTTSEVAARLRVTPGAVSQQLAALRRAGMVQAHRNGRGVYSSLTPLGERLVDLLEG
jgi:DNA-binding transcriptional ArsR family regulator